MPTPRNGNRTAADRAAADRLRGLEAMLDAIADYAVITLDAEGRVARWSRGAEALTGHAPAEAIGQPAAMLRTAEDRDAGLPERDLASARATGRCEVEGWRLRGDGRRYWARGVLTAMRDGQGRVTGFVEVTHDATAAMRAETMFRGLLESAPDAIVIVEESGRIALVNRKTEELFGYGRAQLIGHDVEMLVPERFRAQHPALRNGFFAAARARPMGAGLELFAVRRDGSEFPVEISLSPLETDSGILVSAAIRDVTERRDQLRQLRRQRDEILELSTPVIQVWDKVLALPIIGTLDSNRAARLTESLLEKIAERQAEVIILDISGVPTIDTMVAQHLLKTVQAATLMGAVSIMSGVRPETAQAMVHLGIDIGHLRSRSTLRDALQLALQIVRDRVGDGSRAERTVTGEGGL